MIQAWFRPGSGFVHTRFSFFVLAFIRLGSGLVQALIKLGSGLVWAWFRLGSGFAKVLLRGSVQGGFRFLVWACLRLRSDLRLLRAWFRLGSGLVWALFRFCSGLAEGLCSGLVQAWFRLGSGLV